MEIYYRQNLSNDVIPEELSELIPDEILYNIMMYLSPETVLSSCRINSRYNAICNDKPFWKEKLLRDYGILDVPFNMSDKDIYINLTYDGLRKVPIYHINSITDEVWIYINEHFADVYLRISN